MRKFIKIIIFVAALVLMPQILSAQISFSGNASVYNMNNQKIGQQYIYADMKNGEGIMKIGNLTMKAYVRDIRRDNRVGLTAYALRLYTKDNKELGVAVTKYDKGGYTLVCNFGDGRLRFDLN